MKYLEGFRDTKTARALTVMLGELAAKLPQSSLKFGTTGELRVMEVCGSHTMAIARYGIRSVLPPNVDLLSGPGCPVCVTDAGYIDAALELSRRRVTLFTFGDMMKVPGSEMSLEGCRMEGAKISVCYSPMEMLSAAEDDPENEYVFLAIGFETTVGPVLGLLEAARKKGLKNISLLTAFKTIPPALHVLAGASDVQVGAFLCPAHVSAVIGASAYEPIASSYSIPCVVAGFEPLDILYGLVCILRQVVEGRALVDNQYSRVVRPSGNGKLQALMAAYLEPVDAIWRGLGPMPGSGLGLKQEFSEFDAVHRHGVEVKPGRNRPGCRCGEVLKGVLKPPQCALFSEHCTPWNPIGPCMVSSEGSCAAHYRYLREVG